MEDSWGSCSMGSAFPELEHVECLQYRRRTACTGQFASHIPSNFHLEIVFVIRLLCLQMSLENLSVDLRDGYNDQLQNNPELVKVGCLFC